MPTSPPAAAAGEDERAAAKLALAWTHTARFLTTASKLAELPVDRAAGDRLRRPLERRQVDGDQCPDPAEAPRLRLEDAGPHAAHQPVRARPEARGRRAVRRPARLRLRRGRAQRQAALAAGDGRVPRGPAQPGGDRRCWSIRGSASPSSTASCSTSSRRASANGSVKLLVLLTKADKLNRRRSTTRWPRAAGHAWRRCIGESADVGVAPFSALSRQGVNDAAVWLHRSSAVPGGVPLRSAAVAQGEASPEGMSQHERRRRSRGRRAIWLVTPCWE